MVTESGWPGSGAHLAALLAGHCAALVDRNLLTLLRSVRNLRSGYKYCKSIRMLCGSPSCTDAQHSPLERTGSSGWAHCDKSPPAPVNKTFKLGSQACLSNHVTAHCPYPCWLKQSFKKFPSILERFAQSYKRLIRTSPPELVGTIYVCKPHLILWVSGAQGIGQQHGLKDTHWAPLASVLASVTLSGASGADSPVCCPAPGGKYLSIADSC